jgi:exonuclease III
MRRASILSAPPFTLTRQPTWAVVLAASAALTLPRPAGAQPDGLRVLTYNTAFVYLEGDYQGPIAVPCAFCNPLQIPPGPPACTCPSISMWWNEGKFGNVDEPTRAQKIADRIVATDQDVVALQEVFAGDAKQVFKNVLSANGYVHYVSLLRGVQPYPSPKLSDYAALQDGWEWANDFPNLLDVALHPPDSGLMLFSKYPFLPLKGGSVPNDAICPSAQCQFEGMNGNAPLPPGFFAFKVYPDCAGSDCFASKGVGLVKIQAPRGPYYVAFTHLQSDEDSDGWPARQKQYATVKDVILGAIPPAEWADAAVFVAGDLNTEGYERTKADPQEWHQVYYPPAASGTADGFFACGNGVRVGGVTQPCRLGINDAQRYLTDSWGFETSPTDEGNDGRRLDYLLHSSRGGRLCMQHAMIAWDLQADPDGNGGAAWLSDHYPVRGDFNLTAGSCSANDDPLAAVPGKNARRLTFGPTSCDDSPTSPNPPCHQDEITAPPQARITNGGSFQWFKIDQAGTYSIDLDPAVSTAGVAYAVYHHTDLSRPIQPFDPEEGEWGVIYAFPEPPYYIRTFAVDAQGRPDRAAKLRDYTLKVHQHLCRTPIDACVLEPGQTPEVLVQSGKADVDPLGYYVWPETVLNDPLSDLRELWWRFKTSGVKDGHPNPVATVLPTVRMFLEAGSKEAYGCLTAVPPVIEAYDDPLFPSQLVKKLPFEAVETDQDGDWDDDTRAPDDRRLAPPLPGDTFDQLKIYFLKVTRDSDVHDGWNVCNAGLNSSASYHTNLTYFVPLSADATGELDDDVSADDNMRVYMGFGESGGNPWPPIAKSVDVTFDVPIEQPLHGYAKLKGYYVDQVWPDFWETDEHDLLSVWSPDAPFTGIGPLGEWRDWAADAIYLADDQPGEGDYTYLLTFRRCHVSTHRACTNPMDDP